MCDTLVCFHRANNHTAHLSTRLDLDLDLDPVDDLFARIGFQSEAQAWPQALIVASQFAVWSLIVASQFGAWEPLIVELLLDLVAIRGAIQATLVVAFALAAFVVALAAFVVALVAFVVALAAFVVALVALAAALVAFVVALVAFVVALVAAFVALMMMIFYYVCGPLFFYL